MATANLKQGACTSFGGFDISDMEFGPFGDKGARGLFTRTGGPSVSKPKILLSGIHTNIGEEQLP